MDAAVEQVDDRPEQIGQVGLKPGVGKRRDQRIENVGERALQPSRIGQRARVRLVLEGTMAIELQFVEEVGGRRRFWRSGRCHASCSWLSRGGVLLGLATRHARPSRRSPQPGAARTRTRRRSRRAVAQRRTAQRGSFSRWEKRSPSVAIFAVVGVVAIDRKQPRRRCGAAPVPA